MPTITTKAISKNHERQLQPPSFVAITHSLDLLSADPTRMAFDSDSRKLYPRSNCFKADIPPPAAVTRNWHPRDTTAYPILSLPNLWKVETTAVANRSMQAPIEVSIR